MKRILNFTSKQIIISTATIFVFFVLLFLFIILFKLPLNVEKKLFNLVLYASNVAIPLLALINIYVFIYLTREIQKINNVAHEKQIETNRKIAVMSIKNEEFKYYRTVIGNKLEVWRNSHLEHTLFQEFYDEYLKFANNTSYLFPEILKSQEHKIIQNCAREISVIFPDIDDYSGENVMTFDTCFSNVNTSFYSILHNMKKWVLE
jgi:hypothetical protein